MSESQSTYVPNPSPLLKVLRGLSRMIPGDYLKTAIYLNLIERPRRTMRTALNTFYRMDHVYAVLREFRDNYQGNFSILEFGTSDGYAFTKMLYAACYMGMDERVTVHTFDSFEGMPPAADARDLDLVGSDSWAPGEYRGRYEHLQRYCAGKYRNFNIHKGYFEDSVTPALLESLRATPPILVWFDCDYYSSAKTVMERLIPHLPNGCVLYFDEYDNLNFGSRFTGEARLVHEINQGKFGENLELICDRKLGLDSDRIYRFMHFGSALRYVAARTENAPNVVHLRTNDSPLP
ncbi:MAG TPA: class I SAM-dependent methyltransferase [Steroidobacteraceae bacterium]